MYKKLESEFNVTAEQVESAYTIIDIVNRKWVPEKQDALSLIIVLIESRLSDNGSLIGYELKQFLGMIYECKRLDGLLITAWDNKGDHKHILDILAELMEVESDFKMKGKEKEFWEYLQRHCGSSFLKVCHQLVRGIEDLLIIKRIIDDSEIKGNSR